METAFPRPEPDFRFRLAVIAQKNISEKLTFFSGFQFQKEIILHFFDSCTSAAFIRVVKLLISGQWHFSKLWQLILPYN